MRTPTKRDWRFDSADVKYISWLLSLTPGRVRQIIRAMDFKPTDYTRNSPMYSLDQAKRIGERNTKPGPKKNGAKK